MRFLLTSAGISNMSIHNALVELLGKPLAQSSTLCIPTAAYAMPGGAAAASRLIRGVASTPLCELGPSNFPPWQTVYYHLRQFCRTGLWTHLWRGLRDAERERVGKHPHPSAAIMDAQSVKTVKESARISGFDAHKCVKGRKRHLLVDTLGLLISVYVTPADMHGTQGARRLLAGLKYFVPRLKKIWADSAYRGKELADWCKAQGD